jgi:hypothetical protein
LIRKKLSNRSHINHSVQIEPHIPEKYKQINRFSYKLKAKVMIFVETSNHGENVNRDKSLPFIEK